MAAQETTTPQSKERIIFDAYSYLGQNGEDMAVEDIMERDDLTEEEVREQYSEEEIFDRAMEMRDNDYEEEINNLIGWFDGYLGRDYAEYTGPSRFDSGRPVIVSGSIGRWNGTSSGFTVYDSFKEAIDTSPSRFGGDNVFADCEIQKIWDENGHLFLTGAHHDGSVTMELRQLTFEGENAYDAIRAAEDSWEEEPFTVNGRTYDGGDQSILQAIHDLWNDPDLAEVPHYMEKAFGCPAEEYEEPKHPKEQAQTVSLSAEAKSAKESSTQLAQNHGNTAPAHETAR